MPAVGEHCGALVFQLTEANFTEDSNHVVRLRHAKSQRLKATAYLPSRLFSLSPLSYTFSINFFLPQSWTVSYQP